MSVFWTLTDAKINAWLHRDQKVTRDVMRDASHITKYPEVYSLERSYQSSLYFTDCITAEQDAFICVPGSHEWQDGDTWETSSDRHHVGVPVTDPKVKESMIKCIVKRGEMLVWDSRLVHMGGHGKSKRPRTEYIEFKLQRPTVCSFDDTDGIKLALEANGVVLVTGTVTGLELNMIEEHFAEDVASIWNLQVPDHWKNLPDDVFGKANRGGGAWGPICTTRAAWEARLLPNRIKVFENLYGESELVCSIDSVHWSKEHGRLSVMAAFSPRRYRDAAALKRKCIAQAYGIARTTHWAHLGQVSNFGYGNERNRKPQERYQSISKTYRGYGCMADIDIHPDIRGCYVKALANAIWKLAETMEVDECLRMLDHHIAIYM